jgi:hypothetical protein
VSIYSTFKTKSNATSFIIANFMSYHKLNVKTLIDIQLYYGPRINVANLIATIIKIISAETIKTTK